MRPVLPRSITDLLLKFFSNLKINSLAAEDHSQLRDTPSIALSHFLRRNVKVLKQ